MNRPAGVARPMAVPSPEPEIAPDPEVIRQALALFSPVGPDRDALRHQVRRVGDVIDGQSQCPSWYPSAAISKPLSAAGALHERLWGPLPRNAPVEVTQDNRPLPGQGGTELLEFLEPDAIKLLALGVAAAVLPLRVDPGDAHTHNGQGPAYRRLRNSPDVPTAGHALGADPIHFGPSLRAPQQHPRSTIADWIGPVLAALDNVPLAKQDPRNSFGDAQCVAPGSRERGLDRPPSGRPDDGPTRCSKYQCGQLTNRGSRSSCHPGANSSKRTLPLC